MSNNIPVKVWVIIYQCRKRNVGFLSLDDVIKWKHFPRFWPTVRGIHRSPVNSPHKGQWRGALILFICAWLNGWVNIREAGEVRRNRFHDDGADDVKRKYMLKQSSCAPTRTNVIALYQ